MRAIDKAWCGCGGIVTEVETTDDEEKLHGCGRKGHCVKALQCDKCKTRFALSLEAPEYDDE